MESSFGLNTSINIGGISQISPSASLQLGLTLAQLESSSKQDREQAEQFLKNQDQGQLCQVILTQVNDLASIANNMNVNSDLNNAAMRGIIYLKNQILPKILNDQQQSAQLLGLLNKDEILNLQKKISDHAAICIGRILKKHSTLEEVTLFFNGFITPQKCQQLQQNPSECSQQFLRHAIIIIKELSNAKLNAFKSAQWPTDLLSLQFNEVSARTKVLNLLYEILKFIDLPQLLQIAAKLNSMLIEILASQTALIILQDIQNVKFVKSLCALSVQLLNLVPLDKHDFAMFCNYIRNFYLIGFDSQLNSDLVRVYKNLTLECEDSIVLKVEDILGHAIGFIKGLLDNPAIWTSDLLFSDRDPESTGQAEEFLEKQFFTPETLQKILQQTVVNYLALTNEEIDLWKEDSLKFFLHMKYYSNEVKGNLLRERARNLIAGIQLRFQKSLDTFCQGVIEYVKNAQGATDLHVQLEKEAMLQVLEIRLNDDTDVDSIYVLNIIGNELRARDNLIVKRKIIQLLSQVSDFQLLQKDQKLQEEFIREIMNIFSSQDGDNSDLCLKMACVEYMRNFYNQEIFKVDAYAHFLGDVIAMCNQMIQQTYTKNTEILNEILELYRFIVEKYASHASQQQHILQLVRFLKDIWDFFTEKQKELKDKGDDKNQDEEKEEDEINIALQSIIRIMMHIIGRIPLQELDLSLTLGVYEVSLKMVFYSIETQNVILSECTITLLLVLLRRLNNLDNDRELSDGLKQLKHEILVNYQDQLVNILLNIPMQAEYDEEAFKYFILIEEILLSFEFIGILSPQNPSLPVFLKQFGERVIGTFMQQVDSLGVIKYIIGTIRLLILSIKGGYMNQQLNISLAEFLKQQMTAKITEAFDQLEDEEKLTWVGLAAGTVSTLLLVKDYEVAKDLTNFIMSNDQFRQLIISQVSMSEDTTVILFAAYSLQVLPAALLNPDLISNVSTVFKTHVESEIDSQLNYEFRLSRDLMAINDTEEEGLLFEIPDKSLVEAYHKENILKTWVPRELELIKEATANM